MTREPIPILLLAHTLGHGGSERQLVEIARALDRARFTPHVGCFHPGIRVADLKAAGVPIVQLPVRSFASRSAITGARALGAYIAAHKIQIVHAFDAPLTMFAVPAARFYRTPFVISSQRAHRTLLSAPYHHLLRLTDRMVDAIVANSLAVRQELIDSEKVPPNLIYLCRNGIDTMRFRRRDEPRSGDLCIGVVCVLRPEKDVVTLVRAFHLLRTARPGMKLMIAGSGPVLPDLERLRADLALGDSFVLRPSVSDVVPCLSEIDIFVLPSRSESMSNSLMEAMACGCCVVASNTGGNPELVRDGENGLLFRAGDPEHLAAQLRLLVDRDELRRSFAGAGRVLIEREFSIEASARRMAQIYESVMEQRPMLE